MAKKNSTPAIITIKDLCEEFGLDPKKVRATIRSLGFNAPQTGEAGFGPKAKYQWDAEHPDLIEIRAALHKAKEPKAPKKEPVVTKSGNRKLKEAKATTKGSN